MQTLAIAVARHASKCVNVVFCWKTFLEVYNTTRRWSWRKCIYLDV